MFSAGTIGSTSESLYRAARVTGFKGSISIGYTSGVAVGDASQPSTNAGQSGIDSIFSQQTGDDASEVKGNLSNPVIVLNGNRYYVTFIDPWSGSGSDFQGIVLAGFQIGQSDLTRTSIASISNSKGTLSTSVVYGTGDGESFSGVVFTKQDNEGTNSGNGNGFPNRFAYSWAVGASDGAHNDSIFPTNTATEQSAGKPSHNHINVRITT